MGAQNPINPFCQVARAARRERATDVPSMQHAPHKLRRLRGPAPTPGETMLKVPYGRDEKTYNAALRYSRALVKQLYLRDALVLLHQVGLHAEEDLGEGHALVIELASASCLSVWLYHFYGHESYRGQLLTAVKNVLNLLPYAQDADQTRQIEKSLCMVLTHQLDWSLDDLELDSTERQIVDRVLADWPALDFELEFN